MISIDLLLGIIGFIGGLPQLWGSSWREIWLYHYRGIISWRKVHHTVIEVKRKLDEISFKPDIIIGIGRGGTICAGLLCSELMREVNGYHPQIEVVNSKVTFKRIPNEMKTEVDKIELSQEDFRELDLNPSQKILILIAQSFTGHSLKEALDQVLAKQIPRENIKTVALFWHTSPKVNVKVVHKPDIIGDKLPIGKTTPWKIHQALRTDRFS